MRSIVIGQHTWDSAVFGSSVSALEASLPGISTFWVMCDPDDEVMRLQETVGSVAGSQLFTWSTRISAEAKSAPPGDPQVYLTRTGRRAGLKKFPRMPFIESAYRRYQNFETSHHAEIEPLLHRNSGYALGIGAPDLLPEKWTGSVQLLESHFSLSFDFENTIELESLRRKLVALYVSTAIEMGFMPLIPLNRNPAAGHVIFCRSDSYGAVADNLGTSSSAVLEGASGLQKITEFLQGGGGLAYL